MKQIQQSELYGQLVTAIEAQDLQEVTRLIKDKKVDVNSVDKEGYAPLHKAAIKRCPEIVKALMQEGADVNKTDQYGRTPLHVAANYGHTKIVKALTEGGADVNKTDKCGRTPLHEAIENSSAENDHAEMTRILVERGASVDVEDEFNKSPLDYVFERDLPKIVKALIEGGVDANQEDKHGSTLFHKAASYGRTETVKALIEKGANVNQADEYGRTPFYQAAKLGHTEVCQTILSHTARLEASDLYVSQSNLDEKVKFISTSYNRRNDYLQCFENCKRELQKIKEGNESLYDFLREDDVNKMFDIWEKNKNVRNKFDDEENLKNLYPEYADILINKANKVKKEIFLHNHKPLISVLSENSREGFQKMSFTGVKNFFMSHRSDYNYIQQETGVTLMNCLDFEDVKENHVPKLKLMIFAERIKNKDINSNLECPNTEKLQELHRTFN